MKKPSKQWIAILVVSAGMAWGAAAAPPGGSPPATPDKNLISGG